MAEQETQATEKRLGVVKVYIKDFSFESPQAPGVFNMQEWNPNTNLNLRSSHNVVSDSLHEITLTATIDAKDKDGDKTIFLIELHQAGLFEINGYDEQEMGALIGSFCPNVLFPFAREAIATTVQRGGFPEFLLQPINFDALYQQSLQQKSEETGRGGTLISTEAAQAIAVVGAGSWGTALALQFARSGREVRIWGRDTGQVEAMQRDRVNARYLPGAEFPENLLACADLADCIEGSRDVLVAVPSHAFRDTLEAILPLLDDDARVCWATKGFELGTGRLPHQVAADVLGADRPVAVLSGPTFAKEVGEGLLTAMTIAANDSDFAEDLAVDLSDDKFRAYTSDDIVGVEVGAAVKNVLAIGAGMSDGLGFGANARVALITRGLVEMTRLGVALGARKETFMGLAGMGDLVLTCTDNLSRNRRMGLALASGKSIAEAQEEIQQVVEGVTAAEAVHEVAEHLGIEMPICYQVYRIVHDGVSPREAVGALMGRDLKSEH